MKHNQSKEDIKKHINTIYGLNIITDEDLDNYIKKYNENIESISMETEKVETPIFVKTTTETLILNKETEKCSTLKTFSFTQQK